MWDILIALLSGSCIRDVFLDPEEKPLVVVECCLVDNSPQTLHLVYGKGSSAQETPVVEDAEVRLTDMTDGGV